MILKRKGQWHNRYFVLLYKSLYLKGWAQLNFIFTWIFFIFKFCHTFQYFCFLQLRNEKEDLINNAQQDAAASQKQVWEIFFVILDPKQCLISGSLPVVTIYTSVCAKFHWSSECFHWTKCTVNGVIFHTKTVDILGLGSLVHW